MHRDTASKRESGTGVGRAERPTARPPLGLILGAGPGHPRIRRAALTVTGIALAAWVVMSTLGCINISQVLPQVFPQPTTRTVQDTATPEATNTVSVPWPATWTPTATPTSTFTPTPRPTAAPPQDTPRPGYPSKRPHAGGPLTLDFRVNRVWCTSAAEYKIEFALWARGADGVYTYYRDIDKIGGPTAEDITYQLKWTDCGGAPGTFFVKSGDGQQASKLFWVDVPSCCTEPKP